MRVAHSRGGPYDPALHSDAGEWRRHSHAARFSHPRTQGATTVGNLLERHIHYSQRFDGDEALESLVRRAQNGDTTAFRELYETHFQRLFRYTYFRLGDRERARDAVQEVFLVVWRRLPSFEYRHSGAFPAWLFRIAGNVVAETTRRSNRRPVAPADGIPERPVEFEGAVVSRRLVIEMLNRLPRYQKEVLALRFLAGMSLAEVSAVIGKSEGAVEQLQLRALGRLRKEILEE